jgi:ribosomal protein L11 methyltransferase
MSDDAQTATEGRWLELAVEVDAEAVDSVTELFARYGYNEGVVIEEPFTQEPDGENLRVDVTRPFMVRTFVSAPDVLLGTLDEIRTSLWHLGRLRSVGELSVTPRQEEDWANAWKEHYHPVRVGRRVVATPPWRNYQPAAGEVVIELDPGMAFGTGTHPTTRLCLLALEDEILPGDRVFDVGTGSGILAIAAAMLGASSVVAVDTEPVAIRSAMENIERNHVADRVTARLGTAEAGEKPPETYRLVLANIIARVLVEHVDGICASVEPGGTLILSGIIEGREGEVRAAYEGRGFRVKARNQIEDWVALVYAR